MLIYVHSTLTLGSISDVTPPPSLPGRYLALIIEKWYPHISMRSDRKLVQYFMGRLNTTYKVKYVLCPEHLEKITTRSEYLEIEQKKN